MIRILVSACLLGEPVRFDGRDKRQADPRWVRWQAEGRLVPFCPEVAGGLPVPRPPAEIQADGRVVDEGGVDRSREFERGAESALEAFRAEGCALAILKEGSPSCGVHRIYDGTFTRTAIPGSGVTTALLKLHGLAVFSEAELDEVARLLAELERA
jgi:uncharacterized protein YbbK (DUF523 family)